MVIFACLHACKHGRAYAWGRYSCLDFVVSFFEGKKKLLGYPSDQKCIIYLDVWSVHRSAEFWSWVQKTYKWLVLLYVPGNLTGMFQPCNVGMQRVFKQALRRRQLEDVVKETKQYLAGPGNPKDFKLNTRIGTLCNRSVRWFVETFQEINNKELIKHA
jgi:hypothetical protein